MGFLEPMREMERKKDSPGRFSNYFYFQQCYGKIRFSVALLKIKIMCLAENENNLRVNEKQHGLIGEQK